MGSQMFDRRGAALAAAVLVPIGVGTKLYVGPGAAWVVGSLGGSIYVMFWSFLGLTLWPASSPGRVAAGVFGGTVAIEFLQLWHPPLLETLRSTLLGQTVLGGVFSWVDIPFYAVGAVASAVIARIMLGRRNRESLG